MNIFHVPPATLLYILSYPLTALLIAGTALILVMKAPAGPERGLCMTGICLMFGSALIDFLSMPLWFMALPSALIHLPTIVGVTLALISAIGTAMLLLGLSRGIRRATRAAR